MSNDEVETDDEFKERIRRAERAHDKWVKAEEIHARQIEVFSIAAMRAPALAAAGGIAAAIGFFSANYAMLKQTAGTIELFNGMLLWFFVALIFSVLTPGAAYFSQLAYQDAIHRMENTFDHPYVIQTKGTKFATIVGNAFRWLAVIFNIFAIFFVCLGGYKFLLLVKSL